MTGLHAEVKKPAAPKPVEAAETAKPEAAKPAEEKAPKAPAEEGKKRKQDAAPKAEKKAPEAGKPDEKPAPGDKSKPVVTQHEIKIGGKNLSYTATAGTLQLTKSGGEPRANVFFTAYTVGGKKDAKPADKKHPDAAATRPVTFCFNGGPGSSAVWLHMGAFGPRRVVLPDGGTGTPKPPFQLADNEYTLLESTDLVFIDPVSTGYSRAEKGEDPKQFHGFNEDVESVGDFIRLYVSKNQRWQSPKFIMGESYGGIRAAGLSGHLQERYGMSLNGVIIVSGVLDFQTLDATDTNDLAFICYLPTMSSVAFYHKKLDASLMKDRAETVKAAEEFAQGAYASALLKGASLSKQEKEKVAAEVAKFTSLPADLILRENLRVSPSLYFRKLLEKENLVAGRFDGRVIGDPEVGDPSYANVYGAFSSTFNSYVRGELKIENDQPYEILSRAVHPWNYQPFTNKYVNVAGTLNEAIKSNPSLRVYVACGHYDLATPGGAIRHSFDHMTLTEEQRKNIQFGFYEGGHMMYTNLPELEKLTKEITGFINTAK